MHPPLPWPSLRLWRGRPWPADQPFPGAGSDAPGGPFADAHFVTIRISNGRAIRAADHVACLVRDVTARGRPSPEASRVLQVLEAIRPPTGEWRARVTVPAPAEACGNGDVEAPWGLEIDPLPTSLGERRRGIAVETVVTVVDPNGEARWKTAGRARALAACRAAGGRAEALLVAPDGRVLEGATWNVFACLQGELCTPPTDGSILPGVTRAAVLSVAARMGVPVRERTLTLDALRGASALFATNALLPIAPIWSLDGRPLQAPHAWPLPLREVFDADPPA